MSATARQGLDDFAAAVYTAIKQGREYTPAASWPIELESREVLESFERLWRRIGEWDEQEASRMRIEEAATETELTINRRIHWPTRLWWQWRGPLAVMVALVAFAVIGLRHTRIRAQERSAMLDRIRRLRGFASSALHAVYSTHAMISSQRYPPAYRELVKTDRQAAEKAIVVVAGLHGWRRGRDDRNWADAPLALVVWRAIILAVEFCHQPELFRQWEEAGEPEARTFLETGELVRPLPGAAEDLPPFYFQVECPAQVTVAMPFMLEQALVCLLQNAINASWTPGLGCAPITVFYEPEPHAVAVCNQGGPLAPELRAALNESQSFEDFERRIDALLKNPAQPKPGIGLVEAYSIATQCYGGLRVAQHEPKFSIRLHPAQQETQT